ncbi:hypothetical protein A7E78_09670 [Syntrophotalea acetylenivorans]|uniref:Roadblock/LAMTOR2 domain-containing protein n=1 Tax=Syntrophotalea acetylenivorans TaxID=1842532 RepID=A0A1L3GQA6_9BACT|nr:hypothetical protein [Syntrophotalea acetylenivorans]APG28083.1 hypothetical protein A7E78_09670 [Syntrophotalea acetylenivorans]
MRDQSVPLYDLEQAQQILTRLTPVTPGQTQAPILPEAGSSFVRLSLSSLAIETQPKSNPTPQAAGAEPEGKLELPPHFNTWEDCISWCMEVTRSEAAFVVDSQGFIIASRGRIPGRGIECTGAELVCAVELLERMDPDSGNLTWVDFDFDRRRLVGFIAPKEEGEFYIVGLLAPEPAYYSHKQAITSQIIESLPGID